jgi:hypothetical protein
MNVSTKRSLGGLIGLMVLPAVLSIAHPAPAATNADSTRAAPIASRDLAHAERIRSETTARYARPRRGRSLVVTESSSTGVVESFWLLSADLSEERIVPADNGVYYAICPRGATCPYPARGFARPAADFLPRRLALELAVRTFLETSADVVAVSLPTPRFVLLIVQRDELARDVDLAAVAKALGGDPARAPTASLQELVDRITRPSVFAALGLMPTPTGREAWMGVARWRP